MKFVFNNAKNNFDKEHVTPLMLKSNKLKKVNYEISPKNTNYRLCLDQYEDFELIEKIFMNFKPDIYFGYKKILNFLKKNKRISKINLHILQNEGSYISKDKNYGGMQTYPWRIYAFVKKSRSIFTKFMACIL